METREPTDPQTHLFLALSLPSCIVIFPRQIVSGLSYEHAEGRLAALNLCSQLLKRLPEPNLDQLSSVFYLALVVRLVSDPAAECRASAATAINTLLTRISGGVFHQLLDYTGQWFGETGSVTDLGSNRSVSEISSLGLGQGGVGVQNPALRRTAAQAAGIFLQARPELVRKGSGRRLPWVLSALTSLLPKRAADVITAARSTGWGHPGNGAGGAAVGGEEGSGEWEGVYHAVLSIGKAFDALPGACNAALSTKGVVKGVGGDGEEAVRGGSGSLSELFDRLLEALLYPHAWVRLAAARVWGSFFSKRDPGTLAVGGDGAGKGSQRLQGEASSATASITDGRGRNERDGVKERAGESRQEVVVATDDGGQEFLRKRRVLFRLCQNFCSQLNRSQVRATFQVSACSNSPYTISEDYHFSSGAAKSYKYMFAPPVRSVRGKSISSCFSRVYMTRLTPAALLSHTNDQVRQGAREMLLI